MPSTRRTVLASGLLLLSGCTFDETGSGRTTGEPTPTESPKATTRTDTQDSNVLDPDETLQFGTSYVDTGLEITVETPIIDTTFRHDGETYDMPDGEALAFTPIEFDNTSDELLPIDGPIFTLVDGETTVLETHSVDHPEFDPSIRIREMENVSTTLRWSAEGTTIEPDQLLAGTAVFQVPEPTEPSTLSIVYESDRIQDDRFGGDVVAWMETYHRW